MTDADNAGWSLHTNGGYVRWGTSTSWSTGSSTYNGTGTKNMYMIWQANTSTSTRSGVIYLYTPSGGDTLVTSTGFSIGIQNTNPEWDNPEWDLHETYNCAPGPVEVPITITDLASAG